MAVFNLLADGNGGLDWAGFDWACIRFGIDDPEDLIDRLAIIKAFRPPKDLSPP